MEPLAHIYGSLSTILFSEHSRVFTHLLLSYLTADEINITKEECNHWQRYWGIQGCLLGFDIELNFDYFERIPIIIGYWPHRNGTCFRTQAVRQKLYPLRSWISKTDTFLILISTRLGLRANGVQAEPTLRKAQSSPTVDDINHWFCIFVDIFCYYLYHW